MPPRPPSSLLTRLAVSLAVLLSACAESPAKTPPPAEPTSPAERSVPPGLNERFLADDLDVDRYTEIFEGESREVFREREAILAALRISPGMAVADIGAGTGLFEPLLSRAVGPGGRVYAVEIAPRFIEHLKARAQREGLENVRVVLGGERETNLATASIDVAFVCDTYHHFEHPADSLADLRDVIRPGGVLVVLDFERIPGVTEDWILEHVRAGKQVFRSEIEAAGFQLLEEVDVPGLEQNYVLRFVRP